MSKIINYYNSKTFFQKDKRLKKIKEIKKFIVSGNKTLLPETNIL